MTSQGRGPRLRAPTTRRSSRGRDPGRRDLHRPGPSATTVPATMPATWTRTAPRTPRRRPRRRCWRLTPPEACKAVDGDRLVARRRRSTVTAQRVAGLAQQLPRSCAARIGDPHPTAGGHELRQEVEAGSGRSPAGRARPRPARGPTEPRSSSSRGLAPVDRGRRRRPARPTPGCGRRTRSRPSTRRWRGRPRRRAAASVGSARPQPSSSTRAPGAWRIVGDRLGERLAARPEDRPVRRVAPVLGLGLAQHLPVRRGA